MRVAELRPSDRNPRTISTARLENLKRSLEADRAFLEARPLLVNAYPGRENVVVAGNQRLRAAQDLGWEEVPVRLVSLPPEVEASGTSRTTTGGATTPRTTSPRSWPTSPGAEPTSSYSASNQMRWSACSRA